MAWIFSIEQVPELAGLTKPNRRVILLYYFANRVPTRSSSLMEAALVGSIIVGLIGGCLWGAIVWPDTSWGPLFGGISTMTFVMVVFYFANLRANVLAFRQFLQAGHTQLFLQQQGKPLADEKARSLTANNAALDFLRQCRASPTTAGSVGDKEEALKKVSLDTARSSEIMELSGELLTQSLALFDSSKAKQQEAWTALKSLRLGTFLRLSREWQTLQTEAFRLLGRAGDLLHGAQTTLGTAAALFTQVGGDPESEG